MSRRERREVPDYLKQDGSPRGMEQVTLPDWAPALIKNISYDAQLTAIRILLYRLREHDKKLDDEIKQLHEYKGSHKDRAVDEWVDLVHGSIYQGAAHSMAAVGMLAPFIESVFCGGFETIREEFFEDDSPYDAHPHARWQSAAKSQWDCHFVHERGKPRKCLVEGIFQLAEAVGLHSYLPPDLKPMMEALFTYRNKMFHSGFEWPPEERAAFKRYIVAKNWPSDWFAEATHSGEPWIFYLTDVFVDHCIDLIEQIVHSMGIYVEAELKAERL
jgi:hypothetical protein